MAKIAGFYREVDDLINWAAGPDFVFRPSNIDSAQIWGVEAEVVVASCQGLVVSVELFVSLSPG